MLMQAPEVSKRRFSGTRAGHYASRAQDNSSIYRNTVAISERELGTKSKSKLLTVTMIFTICTFLRVARNNYWQFLAYLSLALTSRNNNTKNCHLLHLFKTGVKEKVSVHHVQYREYNMNRMK